MKFNFLLCFCLYSWSFLCAQSDTVYLKVDAHLPIEGYDFYCQEIVDRRQEMGPIGTVKSGVLRSEKVIYFDQGFEQGLRNAFNKNVASKSKGENFICLVHRLQLSQRFHSGEEIFILEFEVELVEEINGELISRGVYETEEAKLSVWGDIGIVDNMVSVVIKNSVLAYKTLELKQRDEVSRPIRIKKPDSMMIIEPKVGAYYSLEMLKRNIPIPDADLKLERSNRSKKFPQYSLAESEKASNNFIKYIYDGQDVYINLGGKSRSNVYVRSKELGRYMYFECGKSDSEMKLAYGLLGDVSSFGAKAFILDVKEKELLLLTEQRIFLLTKKEHKDLLDQYRNSSRKLPDMQAVIRELNERESFKWIKT